MEDNKTVLYKRILEKKKKKGYLRPRPHLRIGNEGAYVPAVGWEMEKV